MRPSGSHLLAALAATAPQSAWAHYWVAVSDWRAAPRFDEKAKAIAEKTCDEGLAQIDQAIVMTYTGHCIEVQGTAEGLPFSRSELDDLLGLAEHGIAEILDHQAEVLATPPTPRS